MPASTSEAYLRTHRLQYHAYDTVLDGLRALTTGKLDAMVYDAPLLRYLAAKELPGRITVLPNTFERQYYGIALPEEPLAGEDQLRPPGEDSPAAWRDLLYQYLGQEDRG